METREGSLDILDRQRLIRGKQQRFKHFFQVKRHAEEERGVMRRPYVHATRICWFTTAARPRESRLRG
jgi:hypothetical protein